MPLLRHIRWTLVLAWLGCSEVERAAAPAIRPLAAGKTLRVYNFENYLGRATVPSFEERTGAKVVLETYHSNEELLRALEGGARHDVVFPSSYAVERLIRRGLLCPMNRELVPNLIQVPERFRNPPVDPSLRHCVPYTWSMTGLGLVSSRTAPGRDPDTLQALFADRGPKVLMLDDMRATLGVALRYLGLSANTQSAEEIGRAKALLGAQSARVLRYVMDAGPALAAREATLGLTWSGDALEVVKRNPEVRFVVPREGTILSVDYACVPRSAPSPELAFTFLNHLLDPQMAAEFTNTTMFATPNIGAQRLLTSDAKWLWATLDAVKDQGHFETVRDVGPALPLYEQAWTEVRSKVVVAKR